MIARLISDGARPHHEEYIMIMIIFEREYDGETLVDIEEDVWDAINGNEDLPVDKHGFNIGTFKVTISWERGE